MKKVIATPDAPKAVGPYSQAIEVNGTLYISGQIPVNPADGKVQEEHSYLYWEFSGMNSIAVRNGDWKLIVNRGKCSLYNLLFDTHEDIDIANLYPEKVSELIDIIYKEHTDNPIFPITLPVR